MRNAIAPMSSALHAYHTFIRLTTLRAACRLMLPLLFRCRRHAAATRRHVTPARGYAAATLLLLPQRAARRHFRYATYCFVFRHMPLMIRRARR